LQLSGRRFPGTVLAPDTEIWLSSCLELDLSKTFPGLSAHYLVLRTGYPAQSGGPAVEGQTQGVENGGLARTGGTHYGKETIVKISLIPEVYGPSSLQ
jgi:hypothetical protein